MSAEITAEIDEAFVETAAPVAAPKAAAPTVAEGLATAFRDLGVTKAFGVCGGAQALLWAAFSKHLDLLHFRHEAGAAFAATEAHFASDRPVVVFTTTGPGITNALTGLLAARSEGAKIVLVSAYATAARRGRGGIQETSGYTMPTSALFEAGPWFDDAAIVESPEQLPQILRRIQRGFARPGGFVAHLTVPNAIQGASLEHALPDMAPLPREPQSANPAAIARAAAMLSGAPFAIWAGFGARHAAAQIRTLAERAGAPVMCSPRAKGVFPEDHPLFVGVTGMGGHGAFAAAYMRDHAPRHVLVLGTRLGEPTSFWNPALIPADGFIHVDIDPMVPGIAYPGAKTFGIQAEVGEALDALLAAWPEQPAEPAPTLPRPHPRLPTAHAPGPVRPAALMAAIQAHVVDDSDAVVLAESGNAFTWATHFLRFAAPGRYRVSTNLGSMGHAATGAVGAALGGSCPAVAIVGDGALLMNCGEINTAAKRGLPVVWIVLNDGRYNMCHQGMAALQMGGMADACFPPVDFAALGTAMGARGIAVSTEAALDAALTEAMRAHGPVVLDIQIDAEAVAPTQGRNEGLRPTQVVERPAGMSFPVLPTD